ncbi:hypothetical protein BKA56DRAFT_596837 [Ilyonectria sp. MPI-CAGE-AT-0026]|nr:hypothetical protein BKA56DRAFT_596837 [Ilyonectria sp. MPI-CAGE-AT-0026]
MPSPKAVAIAVTALAASGINASLCKPETTTTTPTETPTTTPTPACDTYGVLDDFPYEETVCGAYPGTITDGVIISDSPAPSFSDCVQRCVESDKCKILSYDFPGREYYCRLYSEYTLTPETEYNQYYERSCLGCSRGRGRGRGGRRR